MKKFLALIVSLVLSLQISASLALATNHQMQVDSGPEGGNGAIDIQAIFRPAQFFNDPSSIINLLLSNLLLIAGIGLFMLVVFAGFQMITSGGDAHKMEQWRNMLVYGVAGFVVILLAGAVIQIVEMFTGVNILNPEAVLNQ